MTGGLLSRPRVFKHTFCLIIAASKKALSVPIIFLLGCSGVLPESEPLENIFIEDYQGIARTALWRAALQTLRDFGIDEQNEKKGEIRTAWVSGWSDRPFGPVTGGIMGATWRRRFRFRARILEESGKIQLRLITFMEEKPPAGPDADRWERVASTGRLEREIFDQIRARVTTLQR